MTMTEQIDLRQLTETFAKQEDIIKEGGGARGQARQRKLGRLLARERIEELLDDPSDFRELGIWAGFGMYEEYGGLPAAGAVAVIGKVSDRKCMIIANDATVKAGSFFPQTCKKILRAQRIAFECQLPVIYLVDSSGVFLPLQDEVFPDEDDFGRVFRNNSVMSAEGLPQIAAVMGNCIAGGGYLPVLCDKLLMTEGSLLVLAGPHLVKAAIGQEVSAEELGGAKMHAEISGTVDFYEPSDKSCLAKIKRLVADLKPDDAIEKLRDQPEKPKLTTQSKSPPLAVYDIVDAENKTLYDVHNLLDCIVDEDSLEEYKAQYGKTLVTAYAQIGGQSVGIVATQKVTCQSANGMEIGGVIYGESADKAARFVLECNQTELPLIFFQDVMGFMVGRDAEQSGIIRRGAKLVNAISNSTVPKITVIVGSSYGAGNYALCGKAYDPTFVLAWPNAKYAVMGAEQAARTVFNMQKQSAEKAGVQLSDEELHGLREEIRQRYANSADIRHGAARGWVDAIIAPHRTRDWLIDCLDLVTRKRPYPSRFHTGVFQV